MCVFCCFFVGGKYMNWQRFFFYDMRTRAFENSDKRDAGKGQWRVVEKDQEVQFSAEQVIAKKTVLVFWKAKGRSFAKTNWFMDEFRLALKANPSKVHNTTVSIHHLCYITYTQFLFI